MSKVVLCTGASGGIGAEICRSFAREGYSVVAVFGKNQGLAEKLEAKLAQIGGECRLYRCDVSNRSQVFDTVSRVVADFKQIDVLVNCAGISHFGCFDSVEEEVLDEVLDTNLKGAMLMTQAVLPTMLAVKSGAIINISSMWGEVGASCEVIYSATKAGLIGFTKALAKEVGPSGIRVNCVAPGLIETPMNSRLSADDISALVEETPLGKIGVPTDVANAVVFLASQKAGFITGEVLKVNGGFVI